MCPFNLNEPQENQANYSAMSRVKYCVLEVVVVVGVVVVVVVVDFYDDGGDDDVNVFIKLSMSRACAWFGRQLRALYCAPANQYCYSTGRCVAFMAVHRA